jgi:hypothetical protein
MIIALDNTTGASKFKVAIPPTTNPPPTYIRFSRKTTPSPQTNGG